MPLKPGEEALCRLPTVQEGTVDTPCGTSTGKKKTQRLLITVTTCPAQPTTCNRTVV